MGRDRFLFTLHSRLDVQFLAIQIWATQFHKVFSGLCISTVLQHLFKQMLQSWVLDKNILLKKKKNCVWSNFSESRLVTFLVVNTIKSRSMTLKLFFNNQIWSVKYLRVQTAPRFYSSPFYSPLKKASSCFCPATGSIKQYEKQCKSYHHFEINLFPLEI